MRWMILVGLAVLCGCSASLDDPPTTERQTRRLDDTRWRSALADGDGNDWAQLSDRDKMALCLEAAKVLGKDDLVAWEYRKSLAELYEFGDASLRQHKIRESLAACQILIDKDYITVDAE